MVHKLTAAVLLAALLAGCSEGQSGDGTGTKEEADTAEETASPENENGQQAEGGEENQVEELDKNEAFSILETYRKTFEVETSQDGTVKNYSSKEELQEKFKTVMSPELAAEHADNFFEMDNGRLKIIATEPPVWLDMEKPAELKKVEESVYQVIQERNNELRGHRQYTFNIVYADSHWVVDEAVSEEVQPLTKEEAENIVREQLEGELGSNTRVEFDHKADGKFVIHVYDLVQDDKSSHTATRGWYEVDPGTKAAENMFGSVESDEPSEQSAEEMAKSIVKALENENYGAISEYVSKEKGLLISPYEFIESDAVVLSKEEVENLSSVEKEYLWGYHDGSGKPIRSVPQAYFDRYKGFTEPDQIILDDVQQRGNTKNNIKEIFPDSKTVEFYQNGTDKYGGMDWRSLYLVFLQDAEGKLKLSALVTGEWTI
jgi:hypothetical protein